MKMNREIIRLAIPNIISNITVPLMGIVSTAIAGHYNSEHSAATIGALAIGVSIFNFIYWNCAFVRMGTSGLTAQAFGAENRAECTRMLLRAIVIAAVLGVAVLLLQYPLGEASLWAMNGNELVADYFYMRIWAVPAGILLFALNGWFTGMQNAIIPMIVAVTVNVIHIICSFAFAFGLDMGIVGVAQASVVAQWCGVVLATMLLFAKFRHTFVKVTISEVFDRTAFTRFFAVNGDIMIRTFCIVIVYTFFTAISARMDEQILAVNTLLMQLFTLFSYMSDGFAYAAEALTGRFTGAKDATSLRKCVRLCIGWSVGIAIVFVGAYLGWWRELLGIFVDANQANASQLIDLAGKYIGWVIAIPLACSIPFLLDGVMVGATLTRVMRNAMLLSTVAFFALFYGLQPIIGNNALWLAFTSYMVLRGIFQYLMTHRLEDVYLLKS
ncbi:MAG: MATE family efflux transporter [Bacteroidaceae bacterium]|nr:MATE family efflux transporter [Bacteroidaceae bacterium]